MVQREDCDAGGHECHNEVFVERVALAEDCEVQKHDGEEFAGLGEDEGDIVDVSEGGIAEGGGQRGCDGDEKEWEED